MIAAFAGLIATIVGAIGPVLLAAAAVAVVVGGVAAISNRDGRLATIGLAVALTAGPFVGDPLPEVRGLAARVVGALLTVYLLILVERTGPTRTAGTRIGWAAEALVAATAAIAGLAAAAGLSTTLAGVGVGPAGGPSLSQFQPFGPAVGAGLSLVVLSVGPILFAQDAIALGVGVLLATNGVLLIRAGIAGPPSGFEELASAAFMVTLGAAAAVIVRAATATSGELRDPALAEGYELADAEQQEGEEGQDEEEDDQEEAPLVRPQIATAEVSRRAPQAPRPAPSVVIWPELAAPARTAGQAEAAATGPAAQDERAVSEPPGAEPASSEPSSSDPVRSEPESSGSASSVMAESAGDQPAAPGTEASTPDEPAQSETEESTRDEPAPPETDRGPTPLEAPSAAETAASTNPPESPEGAGG